MFRRMWRAVRTFFERIRRPALSVATLGAATAAMTLVVPVPMALTVAAVIAAHEAGHYLAGYLAAGFPTPPVFIPLVIGTAGITRVEDPDPEWKPAIALAGPASGLAMATGLGVVALATANPFVLVASVSAGMWEVINGTVGSDGRRFRRERRGLRFAA